MHTLVKQFIEPISPRATSRRVFLILLIVITGVYFFILQSLPTLLDPDGFYHAKMALLTSKEGFVSSFPYLPETIIDEYWTDQHWLYHVALVPFVLLFDPLWGVKIATWLFGTLFIILFYLSLNRQIQNSRAAFWWTMLLLTAAPLVARLTLVKAQPFALVLLLVGYMLFTERKYILLGSVQLLYVLSHGSFLLLPALIVWSLLGSMLFERKQTKHLSSVALKSGVVVVIGILLGISVQPTFPQNIVFYYHQIITIGLIGIPELAETGLEWRHITLSDLLQQLVPFLIIMLSTLWLSIQNRRSLSRSIWVWWWLLIPLGVLAILSIRNLELFIPFAVVTLAVTWKELVSVVRMPEFGNRWIISIFGGMTLVVLALFPLVVLYSFHQKGIALTTFKDAGEIIMEYTGPEDMIINSRWDMFPMLFYYTDSRKFITGLDPGFLYVENKVMYDGLVEARTTGSIGDLVRVINPRYPHLLFAELILQERPLTIDPGTLSVTRIFSDGDTNIYFIDR